MRVSAGVFGLVAILAAAGQGCSSTGDAVAAKADGTAATYPVTADQAWNISRTVFRWEGCEAVEEHRNENYMVATMGPNLITWGTVAAAWVEPAGDGNTCVTVVTKRKSSFDMATRLREGTFHERFEQGVRIIKAGQSLPAEAPEE